MFSPSTFDVQRSMFGVSLSSLNWVHHPVSNAAPAIDFIAACAKLFYDSEEIEASGPAAPRRHF
jgi:hypothetical protein